MLAIGDFSKLSQTTVRTLRYYDEVGLLKPLHVDRFTGYRYYSFDQLPRLNRILALKGLGFSLEQVAELLNEALPPDQIRGMLRLKQAELRQRVQEEQTRLVEVEARLNQIEQEQTMSAYDVLLKPVEPQTVAAIREVLPVGSDVGRLFYDIESYLGEHKAPFAGYPMSIWHDSEYRERDLDAEAAIPVGLSTIQDNRISLRQLPGFETVASVVHRGSYDTIMEAYSAVGKWIEANGYRIAGPGREVYLRYGPSGAEVEYPSASLTDDPAQFVTEVQFPVEKV